MKKLLLFLVISSLALSLTAQKQITREAFLKFYSAAALEDIEASTNSASSVIDMENGELVCQVLMKSLVFDKALMQEHFNENYMESDQFPKGVFKGKFDNWEAPSLKTDGEYKMTVNGTLSLHGKSQKITTECKMLVNAGKLTLSTIFMVHPADFDIDIPSGKKDNISNDIEITFIANYQPL